MKKLLALVLAMVMTMALVACGGDKNDSQPPADDQTQTDTQTPETPEEPAVAGELTLWTYPIGLGQGRKGQGNYRRFHRRYWNRREGGILSLRRRRRQGKLRHHRQERPRPDHGRSRASGNQLGRQGLSGGPERHV